MLSTYMQHRQCDRLLSFDFLPFAQQPPKRTLVDSAVGAARAGQGRAYEAQVLEPGCNSRECRCTVFLKRMLWGGAWPCTNASRIPGTGSVRC